VAWILFIVVASPLFGVFAFGGLVPLLLALFWAIRLLMDPYAAGWHDKSARSIVVYGRGITEVPAEQSTDLVPSGMWPRVGSWFIDGAVLQVITVAIGAVMPTAEESFAGGTDIDWNAILTPVYQYIVILIVYKAAFHPAVGATPGKLLMGLTVVRESDEHRVGLLRLLAREPLFLILLSVPLLNLAWFLFTAGHIEHRGWHDRVAGSVVMISV
jgi:uncharacterized RDD family membrane protein YckC